MAMYGRFVVVEAGEGGIEPLLAEVGRAVGAVSGAAGVRKTKGWMGFPFQPGPPDPAGPDLRLVALSAVGDDVTALDEAVEAATVDISGAARYDLLGACVKAAGSGWGFEVPTHDIEPLDHDEPVLVVITGELRAEHLDDFRRAGAGAVEQAQAHAAYLGGCGLASTMLDITSFSCWASARDARRYAWGDGGHARAMAADRSGGWHVPSTELFMTYRILRASGSLLGRQPFVEETAAPAAP